MQKGGTVQFIQAHSGAVKGVAFSPKDRYVFCSCGTDGKINLYDALLGQHTMSTRITGAHAMKNITAVKFNADGSRILSTTSKRFSVIDVERGELICSYDNCAYPTKDRAPLASDPNNPHLATCCCSNGKGWITFDLRKQQPAVFAFNIHSSIIRDIVYLDGSWPFGVDRHQGLVVSLGVDGMCKMRTIDNFELHSFDVKHRANCLAPTPGTYQPYDVLDQELIGFESILMIGGDCLTGFLPGPNSPRYEAKLLTYDRLLEKPIQKLKHTSNGHYLYSITSGGQVSKYRRFRGDYNFVGDIYAHNDEIIDMDLSPNDEYIVTGAKDGKVGLLCLGAPSHGWTGFMELA